MIKHFTKFEGKPNGAARNQPRVTLNHKKTFVLNQLAYEALGGPAAVEFFFDENRKVIGLKPIDARRENAFPLKSYKGSNLRRITASAFCTHFRISVDHTVLFQNIDLENDGMMTLDMAKTVNVSRGSR
jgi:hypothetical protein